MVVGLRARRAVPAGSVAAAATVGRATAQIRLRDVRVATLRARSVAEPRAHAGDWVLHACCRFPASGIRSIPHAARHALLGMNTVCWVSGSAI